MAKPQINGYQGLQAIGSQIAGKVAVKQQMSAQDKLKGYMESSRKNRSRTTIIGINPTGKTAIYEYTKKGETTPTQYKCLEADIVLKNGTVDKAVHLRETPYGFSRQNFGTLIKTI